MAKNKTRSQPASNGESGILPLPWHDDVQMMLAIQNPPVILLVGEPGSGKTTFARHVAIQFTNQPPLVLSGSAETTEQTLFGRWTLVGGETRFMDGPLPAALKTGRWLVIEEFSLIPIDVRAHLMPLRLVAGDEEGRPTLTNPVNDEVLPIPSHFRLIATSNSETLSCRKNSGTAKVLFDGLQVFEVPELDDIQVGAFLRHHFPTVKKQRIGRVLELWNEYRSLTSKGSSGKNCLSYRAAAHLMALLERDMEEERAVQIALVNKFMSDSDLFSAAKLKNSLSGPTDPPEAKGNPEDDEG